MSIIVIIMSIDINVMVHEHHHRLINPGRSCIILRTKLILDILIVFRTMLTHVHTYCNVCVIVINVHEYTVKDIYIEIYSICILWAMDALNEFGNPSSPITLSTYNAMCLWLYSTGTTSS